MKKIYYLLLAMTVLIVCASCNNEWESEQYVQMVSFKAPVNAHTLQAGRESNIPTPIDSQRVNHEFQRLECACRIGS